MTSMIQGLGNDFSAEIKTKQDALDLTQMHLRAATRQLAEQRKQIQTWQTRCAELDQVRHRIRNLDKAIIDEDDFDWTGRTGPTGSVDQVRAEPAFQLKYANTAQLSPNSGDSDTHDLSIPINNNLDDLVRLKRMLLWRNRIDTLLGARLASLHGVTTEKEFQCKKIIALCTGISIDKVEDVRLHCTTIST